MPRILKYIGEAIPQRWQRYMKDRWYYDPIIQQRGITADKPQLFPAIFFEVVTKCNSRCSFCAASRQNEKRKETTMDFSLFSKVIAELKELDYKGRVAFHVNNDPLCFKDLEEYVGYVHQEVPAAHIQIMTNGLALTPERGEKLLQNGVNELHVDFYRKDKKQELYRGVRRFRDEVLPRYYPRQEGGHVFVSETGEDRFKFKIDLRLVNEIITSRGGTSPNKKARSETMEGFCIFPWVQFNVTTDGRVNKCCADLYFSDPMGNVAEQSIMDIWHGPKFTKVRETLLRGERASLPNCRECDFFGLSNFMIKNPLLLFLKYHFLAARVKG